jgi:hypothetical protein
MSCHYKVTIAPGPFSGVNNFPTRGSVHALYASVHHSVFNCETPFVKLTR